MLKVEKLHKYYHNFGRKPLHVIDNTSIEIPETGIIAVVGESGAGKTTLINTISGLDSFKKGTISFDDVIMKHYSNHKADKLRLQSYGFIFQNYYLLEKQTVYENVKVSLDAFDISEEEKKKRVNYVLKQLGIARYTNKLVTSLSGGEQQRVSIARALVKSPRVIFADEPTGSLDEKTTFNVLNILKKVSKTCAVFIVTHERDIISYYADYIIEIDKGVVVKEYTPVVEEGKSLSVDRNIYLGELNEVNKSTNEDISVDIYSDSSKGNKENIKIAIQNGKIYLEASEGIIVLGKESENHLLEGKKKVIKDYVDNDFVYELEPLKDIKNKVGLKEVFKKGYRNYKRKNPIRNILKFVCVILSMILLTIVESMNTIQNADLSASLLHSKGNYYMEVLPNSDDATSSMIIKARKRLYQEIISSGLPGEVDFEVRDTLIYNYEGFYQIEGRRYLMPQHDFKSISTLNKKDIVYGEMPTNAFEVVLDEYILENFLSKSVLENVVTNYAFFVGKKLTSNYYDYEFTISGICRTKSPTIYSVDTNNLFRLSYGQQVRIIDIETAKKNYPTIATFQQVNLPSKYYFYETPFTSTVLKGFTGLHFDIPEGVDFPYFAVINKEDMKYVKEEIASNVSQFYISIDRHINALNDYQHLVKKVQTDLDIEGCHVLINLKNLYQEEFDEAVKDLNSLLKVVEIMAIVMGAIALLLIIFSIYLSMLSQISDIAIYRSLGYSRAFLATAYLVELSITALLFSFIGGAITYLTLFVLDVIPIVPYTISSPFIQMLAVVLLLATLIIIIGMIPIIFVFRLTPANIYNRYNKKISG